MSQPVLFDSSKELDELTNQLSISRRIGFFLGAGVSAALGLPDIAKLTELVESSLLKHSKEKIKEIKKCLSAHGHLKVITIEDILNQIRLIRMLTKELDAQKFSEISGAEAKKLDAEVCNKISEILSEKEKGIDLSLVQKYLSWLNWLNRDFTKEIFTTNYDLILERSLESLQIPYFDGFVGGNEAFFYPESIELKNRTEALPLSWIRMWKLHGSFNWFWKKNKINGDYRVVRMGALAKPSDDNTGELVIYPSREKYEASRKQPFITYFDRLNNYLQEKEGLFVISGYSFMDQHINQIIFNSAKQNNRLHIAAFLFNDDPIKIIEEQGSSQLNFSAYSPNKAIIGGKSGSWDKKAPSGSKPGELDLKVLGDFKQLIHFFIETSGKKSKIEDEIQKSK